MIIILFILIFFVNISHEVIYDCNNKIPIKCISDISQNDICQYCKCYKNNCKQEKEIIMDVSNCIHLRIDMNLKYDFDGNNSNIYTYQLRNFYNKTILYQNFSGYAKHQDGFIIDKIYAKKVVFLTNITNIYTAISCLSFKNYRFNFIILFIIFASFLAFVIIIIISIIVWNYYKNKPIINRNNPFT